MAGTRKKPARNRRPFLGITFECCRVYTRVYLNADGSAFTGACPKCAAPIRIKTAPGGSKSRFWSVG